MFCGVSMVFLSVAGDATGDHMRTAQICLREGNQDCTLFVAGGEIDIADQARHQARGVETRARIEGFVERKTRNGERHAPVSGVGHCLAQVVPE